MPLSTEHKKYDCVISDPPWHYTVNPGQPGVSTPTGAALNYDLMTDEQVWDFPMAQYVERGGILFLWATCPKLDVAMKALEYWGFHYRGVAFVWVKTSQNGVPWRAKGVRPSITKPLTELVLAASTTKTGRPIKLSDESICQTVFATPGAHSQKPEEVQDRIDLMYPEATKLELFARRQRPGWDCEGDELE